MNYNAIAVLVGALALMFLFAWLANKSRKLFADAANEVAKDVRENTAAVKALTERIDKLQQ